MALDIVQDLIEDVDVGAVDNTVTFEEVSAAATDADDFMNDFVKVDKAQAILEDVHDSLSNPEVGHTAESIEWMNRALIERLSDVGMAQYASFTTESFTDIKAQTQYSLESVVETIKEFFKRIYGWIRNGLKRVWDFFKSLFSWSARLKKTIKRLRDELKNHTDKKIKNDVVVDARTAKWFFDTKGRWAMENYLENAKNFMVTSNSEKSYQRLNDMHDILDEILAAAGIKSDSTDGEYNANEFKKIEAKVSEFYKNLYHVWAASMGGGSGMAPKDIHNILAFFGRKSVGNDRSLVTDYKVFQSGEFPGHRVKIWAIPTIGPILDAGRDKQVFTLPALPITPKEFRDREYTMIYMSKSECEKTLNHLEGILDEVIKHQRMLKAKETALKQMDKRIQYVEKELSKMKTAHVVRAVGKVSTMVGNITKIIYEPGFTVASLCSKFLGRYVGWVNDCRKNLELDKTKANKNEKEQEARKKEDEDLNNEVRGIAGYLT